MVKEKMSRPIVEIILEKVEAGQVISHMVGARIQANLNQLIENLVNLKGLINHKIQLHQRKIKANNMKFHRWKLMNK